MNISQPEPTMLVPITPALHSIHEEWEHQLYKNWMHKSKNVLRHIYTELGNWCTHLLHPVWLLCIFDTNIFWIKSTYVTIHHKMSRNVPTLL